MAGSTSAARSRAIDSEPGPDQPAESRVAGLHVLLAAVGFAGLVSAPSAVAQNLSPAVPVTVVASAVALAIAVSGPRAVLAACRELTSRRDGTTTAAAQVQARHASLTEMGLTAEEASWVVRGETQALSFRQAQTRECLREMSHAVAAIAVILTLLATIRALPELTSWAALSGAATSVCLPALWGLTLTRGGLAPALRRLERRTREEVRLREIAVTQLTGHAAAPPAEGLPEAARRASARQAETAWRVWRARQRSGRPAAREVA